MTNDNISSQKKRRIPKTGIFGLIGVLIVIGLLITPYGLSPTGNVSADWTNYGSYISSMSTINVYDDEDNLIASWTKNTHANVIDIPIGTTIGNVSISAIIRTTELGNPGSPESCIDYNIWWKENGVTKDTLYDMAWDTYFYLDVDDWYCIAYFNNPEVMGDWTITTDVSYILGIEFKMYVP
jgi:hypothetical protein